MSSTPMALACSRLRAQVMYLALGNVHPVTLAVGNTLKRVFIIVASLVVFRNPITPMGECFVLSSM
jgi:Triose-phosphate Transporter family